MGLFAAGVTSVLTRVRTGRRQMSLDDSGRHPMVINLPSSLTYARSTVVSGLSRSKKPGLIRVNSVSTRGFPACGRTVVELCVISSGIPGSKNCSCRGRRSENDTVLQNRV